MRKRDRSYSRYAGRALGRGNGSGGGDPGGKLTSTPGVPPHVRRGRCKGGAVVAGIKAQPDGSRGLDGRALGHDCGQAGASSRSEAARFRLFRLQCQVGLQLNDQRMLISSRAALRPGNSLQM